MPWKDERAHVKESRVSDLFRKESMDAHRMDWAGSLSIASPPALKFYALAAIVLIVAFFAIACGLHYRQKDHIKGIIAYSYPPASVAAPVSGRLTRVVAKPGEHVQAGEVLGYIVPATEGSGDTVTAIRSPQEGDVLGLEAEEGAQIGAGEIFTRIRAPGSRLVAKFPLPGRDVGFLTPGQAVALHLSEFPTSRFSAIDGEVRALAVTSRLSGEPYELTVAIAKETLESNGMSYPLTPGRPVEATIPLNDKSVFGWLVAMKAGSN
jgi:multidrug efflux pump subunit AcrA (membrane-fusion protein)